MSVESVLIDAAEVDTLSTAMASMHVATLREFNGRLQSKAANAGAAAAALRAELCERTAQALGLARMQEQLTGGRVGATRSGASTIAPASRQPSTGDKRKNSESFDDEPLSDVWRAASTISDVSDADEVEALLSLPTDDDNEEPAAEPVDAMDAASLDSASVHDELRHELRVRSHLECELARHVDQCALLRTRLAHNDALIARLEALNSNLVIELKQMRDACAVRQELHAKRGRCVPEDVVVEHCFCL